jgi:lipopolysaccharide cholinephosphotransferase
MKLRDFFKKCLMKASPTYRKLERIENTLNSLPDDIQKRIWELESVLCRDSKSVQDSFNKEIDAVMKNLQHEEARNIINSLSGSIKTFLDFLVNDIQRRIWGAEGALRNDIKTSRDFLVNDIQKCIKDAESALRNDIQSVSARIGFICDITQIKPLRSETSLRTIQLCNGWLLSEFKRICDENNIQYFLLHGTLLGAVRHGDFVPWDDDLDVGMTMSEYGKLQKVMPHYADFKVVEYHSFYTKSFHYKIGEFQANFGTKIDRYFVDIFTFYDINVTGQNSRAVWDQFISKRKQMCDEIDALLNYRPVHNATSISDEMNSLLDKYRNTYADDSGGNTLILNITAPYLYGIIMFNKEIIFPLKTLKFQNTEYFVPNDSNLVLRQIYGEYYDFPVNFKPGHTGKKPLTSEEYAQMRNFLKEKGLI